MSTRTLAAAAVLTVAVCAWAQVATQPSAPSATELLDQLLQPPPAGSLEVTPAPNPPRIDASTGLRAVAPGGPALPMRREGSYIVDRIGRLHRNTDGQQEFAFDSDGAAMHDPPMILLPNLKLMAMEEAVRNASVDLRFHVSGMVTEYRGRNYLLVEKASAVPQSDFH